jgi:hypothetical protein
MAVTFRTRHVPPEFHALLREAADAALEGDWRITMLQSHLDGQWNLQLEGAHIRCRVVFSSLDTVTLAGLTMVLQQLADDRLGRVAG